MRPEHTTTPLTYYKQYNRYTKEKQEKNKKLLNLINKWDFSIKKALVLRRRGISTKQEQGEDLFSSFINRFLKVYNKVPPDVTNVTVFLNLSKILCIRAEKYP